MASVDVEVGDLVGADQQRHAAGEVHQEPGRDRVELAHVAEGERPQERPECRGGTHRGEQPTHGAVAQQVHLVDVVRPGDHSRDQRHDLGHRVRPGGPRDMHVLTDQLVQTGTLGQRHHRDQASA